FVLLHVRAPDVARPASGNPCNREGADARADKRLLKEKMFTTDWALSPRQYGLKHDRDIAVPVCSGETLDSDIFRPDPPGKYPVCRSVHAYLKSDQTAPLTPIGLAMPIAHIEAGDPNFFVRRGYVHVIMNIRGTGRSSGEFGNLDGRSISEIADAIAWLAAQ